MNSPLTPENQIPELQRQIEAALRFQTEAFTCPAALQEAMAYSLLAGGKRFRPLLVLGAAERCGLSQDEVMPMALAMEMIHTYSLIHDDLPAMDNDDLRRGKPTSHKVFGEALAILAGDALLNEALLLLMSAYGGTPNGARAMVELARSAGKDGMIAGQVLDIQSEGQVIDLPALEEMHRNKTGAIITSSVTAPCLLAGCSKTEVEAMRSLGHKLGLMFQIQDDILDVESNQETLGKSVGKDARDEKSTYVSLLGLEQAKIRLEELRRDLFRLTEHPGDGLLEAVIRYFARRDH